MSNSEQNQADAREKRKRLLILIADILLEEKLITPKEQLLMLELVQKE